MADSCGSIDGAHAGGLDARSIIAGSSQPAKSLAEKFNRVRQSVITREVSPTAADTDRTLAAAGVKSEGEKAFPISFSYINKYHPAFS
jgi:hypothetical protein